MNILILNWRDIRHPLSGGAEISLEKQVKVWLKNGAHVTWFSSKFKGAKEKESINGIKYIRRGNHFTVSLFFFFYILIKGYKEYDVIIDCFHFFPYFTPLYIRRKKIIGLINEVAGRLWFENLIYPLAYVGYILEPYIIRLYKKNTFITVSESTRDDLIALGINKEKINVVHNGFTPPKKNYDSFKKEKNPTLIFLARISKDKGIEDAIEALKKLHEKQKNIMLWVVGKAENENYKHYINKKINDFNLQKNVVFFGFVDESKKFELLSRAWILIHPSRKEGWGLNVIEANSVGTPAIGYNVTGLKDSIINNKTGLLVDSNVINLEEGIKRLINNKKLRENLGRQAIRWTKKFSWEKAGEMSWKIIIN